jgi:hypothetical protein
LSNVAKTRPVYYGFPIRPNHTIAAGAAWKYVATATRSPPIENAVVIRPLRAVDARFDLRKRPAENSACGDTGRFYVEAAHFGIAHHLGIAHHPRAIGVKQSRVVSFVSKRSCGVNLAGPVGWKYQSREHHQGEQSNDGR